MGRRTRSGAKNQVELPAVQTRRVAEADQLLPSSSTRNYDHLIVSRTPRVLPACTISSATGDRKRVVVSKLIDRGVCGCGIVRSGGGGTVDPVILSDPEIAQSAADLVSPHLCPHLPRCKKEGRHSPGKLSLSTRATYA